MTHIPGTRYRDAEIRGLIRRYEELKAKAGTSPGGLKILHRLIDLDNALERLSWKEWEVVLLHGLLDIPQRTVGELLAVSQQAVAKRYRIALEEIHYLMNGGSD